MRKGTHRSSESAFILSFCTNRPLWKLLPATSTLSLYCDWSTGYPTFACLPSLNRAYPLTNCASIPSTQSSQTGKRVGEVGVRSQMLDVSPSRKETCLYVNLLLGIRIKQPPVFSWKKITPSATLPLYHSAILPSPNHFAQSANSLSPPSA